MIAARCILGASIMAVGFWMTAVMSPPDPGGWSLAALGLLVAGATLSGYAALDLFDRGEA